MSLLSVTRSLVSMTNPTEAQFDTMRTGLLNYFNAASMTEANIATGGMVYTSLSKALDDAVMKWTSSAAKVYYISGSSTFQVENTLGAVVWYNTVASVTTESLRLATTGKLTIGSGGLLKINTSLGSQAADTQWLFSRYRKPRLEYVDANIVQTNDNGPNASETLLLLRDRLSKIKDTTLSLAATANGYDAAHVGASVSGIRSGLARATNTWYYVYGALVQGGTDNDGINAVMVADTTTPVQANCATLDTRYGAGKWVYLGLIRNGYNDGVNTNVIVPFVYDGYGTLRFTTTTESELGLGVRLTSSASSADLVYTLTFGVGASDLPVVATRGVFTGYRSTDGFQLDYVNVASGEIQAAMTCCEDTDAAAAERALVHLAVPFINGYKVVVRVGFNSTTNRIHLAELVDHYV
jgi:hypothetical protein